MNSETKHLIEETYRLVSAATLQIQKLQNNVSHLESLVRDVHLDVLERPAERKVVLMKTAPFGANPSEVVQEYENGKTLQEIRAILQQIREDMLKPRFAGAYISWRGEPVVGSERKCGDPLCQICYPTPEPATSGEKLRDLLLRYFKLPLDERTFLYRYAKYPEQRGVMTGKYYLDHNLHDFGSNEELLKVLAELPPKCIM